MSATDAPTSARFRVPATTANLGPGFDCLGLALQLYNEVEIEALGTTPGPEWTVELSGSAETDHLPRDGRNLVARAAHRLFEAAGNRPAGRFALRLKVESPLARGLGSSASAIVGGMAAANALLGPRGLSPESLLAEMVAMEGHPDNIVPCVTGGLTASLTRADGSVTYLRSDPAPNVRFVVLVPDYELSTARAREAIPKTVKVKDAVFNMARVPFVLDRLGRGDLSDLAAVMDDRLHQPYRKPLIRDYEALAQDAETAGAAAVCISGAGPSILAVATDDNAEEVAGAWRRAMAALKIGGCVHVLSADSNGTLPVA